jgi:hypothetical protein
MAAVIRSAGMVTFISAGLGIALYTYVHFSETSIFPTVSGNTVGFILSGINGIVVGLVIFQTNERLNTLLPWNKYYISRFAAGLIVNFIVSVALCFASYRITDYYIGADTLWAGKPISYGDAKLKVVILLLAAIFIYNIIYALLYSYQQYAVTQLEILQHERKQLELQFEVLKSQLSPHYLFNSLNTISSLIHKDVPSAEQFVRRLAQTYQYILSSQQKRYVTLKDEVDFVQSYYYLLRIRFQQQLHVEINLPSNIMNSRIPPLTLQILVENAVKHNRISLEEKLFIYITAQDNTYVRVINTKNGHQDVHSFKVGLENIRKRYAYFTTRKIEIMDDDKFTVALPVIQPNERNHVQQYSA